MALAVARAPISASEAPDLKIALCYAHRQRVADRLRLNSRTATREGMTCMPRVAFDTSTALVNEARALRARRKEDQATFWGRVGIRQSVGCRIERSRRISPYAAILLTLRLQGELDDGQLDALTHAVQGTAVDREWDALVRLALCSPGTYRRRLGEQQAVFWRRVGITQSGGSRLEAGQAMPAPIQMMLAGLVLGVIEPSSLEAVQRRSDSKRPALRVGTKLPTEAVEI